MAFPSWTALAGLALAAVLSLIRARLRAGSRVTRFEPSAPRWRVGEVVWLVGLVLVALVLRLHGLETRPVDNDEPVGLGVSSLGEWARSSDARLHPPLPALAMTLVAGGVADLDRARGLSVLFGVASVALVFAVARASAGRHAGVLAASLVAFAPAALHASQLARGWGWLAAGLLAAHLALRRALAGGRERWFLLYSLLAALAMATEYVAVVPVAAEAFLAVVEQRKERSLLVGVVGAFGAALTAVAFLAPIALPSLALGVGGGPHPATGPLPALRDVMALLSGAGAPFGALVAVTLVLAAAGQKRLAPSDLRLGAALLGCVAVVIAGSFFTAVRARYALAAFPMLAPLAVTSAFAVLDRAGLLVLAGYALGHAALVPGYYAATTDHVEISTGRPTPALYRRCAAEPDVPVAVTPAWAIAEPSWRLGRVFPGRDAGIDCPATLCVRDGQRRFYGVADDEASLARLLGSEPRFFLLARSLATPHACRELAEEAGTTLSLCAR